jgi:hypothetical protein
MARLLFLRPRLHGWWVSFKLTHYHFTLEERSYAHDLETAVSQPGADLPCAGVRLAATELLEARPAGAQRMAQHTRDRKELLSPEEVLQRHRELAAQYGDQADRVVAKAREHGQYQMLEPEMQAQRAVTWARDHVFERSAVQDRRAILETALWRGMGETTYARIRREFAEVPVL